MNKAIEIKLKVRPKTGDVQELLNKMLEIFDLKANVQQGNAEKLPFEDNTFDFISSSGVLHHTPDMQKAVNEAWRVLKPGGEAIISVYYKNILCFLSLNKR